MCVCACVCVSSSGWVLPSFNSGKNPSPIELLNSINVKGVKMKCEVILEENEVYGKFTDSDFNQTLSLKAFFRYTNPIFFCISKKCK